MWIVWGEEVGVEGGVRDVVGEVGVGFCGGEGEWAVGWVGEVEGERVGEVGKGGGGGCWGVFVVVLMYGCDWI